MMLYQIVCCFCIHTPLCDFYHVFLSKNHVVYHLGRYPPFSVPHHQLELQFRTHIRYLIDQLLQCKDIHHTSNSPP